MSSQHRRYRKHSSLSRKQLYAIIAVSLVAVSVLAVYSFHSQANDNEPRAAIIDQLSSMEEFTNATFVETATNMLTTAGYKVTYFTGSDVNVDFYQTLPTDGYRILIFRVHSALRLNPYTGNLTEPLDFFTAEDYSPQTHVEMQALGQLDRVMYNQTSTTQYWGISPTFVYNAMEGNFHNATIILEGCNGLDGQRRSETMLQALIHRGAKVVIGWNASVSAGHTDTATEDLLDHMLLENETVKEAVNVTNNQIGLDPLTSNELLYYPSKIPFGAIDVGNYTVPHDSSTSAATNMSANNALSLTCQSVSDAPLLLSAKESLVLKVHFYSYAILTDLKVKVKK